LLTPREVLRDFIGILNYIHQNPEHSFISMLGDDLLKTTAANSSETDDSEAVEFRI